MEIKYGALNGTEYLAVRKYENGYSYGTLSKGYSINYVYGTRRYLIGDSKLAAVWTYCEERQLKSLILVRESLTRFEIQISGIQQTLDALMLKKN